MSEPVKKDGPGYGVVGFLVVCLSVIGIIAAIGALSAIVGGDHVGAGMCAAAAALPFGLMLYLLLGR